MGHIYRNLHEILIPAEGHADLNSGQVSVYSYQDGARHRMVIGLATDASHMHPNENFKFYYPDLWDHYYSDTESANLVAPRICGGLYALTLGIVTKTGLYKDLQAAFGPEYANDIIDFCMYSIRYRSSSAQLFQDEMEEQMRFSRTLRSDEYFSRLFKDKITDAMMHNFRVKWLTRCQSNGINNAWLCVDGSNNDCTATNSELVEQGHAKSSGKERNVVSYIWAVNASDSRPITCFTNPGSMPDCKAVHEIAKFLAASNIDAKGLIVDRGFASQEFLDLANECKLDSILMLKSNSYATVEMTQRYCNEIRANIDYIVTQDPIFGITDNVKVFRESNEPSCVGLFYSSTRNSCKLSKFIKELWTTAADIREQIKKNPSKVTIPAAMEKYLVLAKEGDVITGVDFNSATCQEAIDRKGYFAIASGTERGAKEIIELYKLRDKSEKQFSIFKSQLNFNTTRAHSDQGIKNRIMIGFISSVIRTEIELACKDLNLDTNVMIRKLDRAYFSLMPNGTYQPIYNMGDSLLKLFGYFGIEKEHFGKFAQELNSIGEAVFSQNKTIPTLEKSTERHRGRKKGGKNKSTLEKERKLQDAIARGEFVPEEKRKPGRPKGSKNKRTLEKERKLQEAIARGEVVPEEKRKPGRPKGSKNKSTLEKERRLQEAIARGETSHEVRRKPRRSKDPVSNSTFDEGHKVQETIAKARLTSDENREHGTPLEVTSKDNNNLELDGSKGISTGQPPAEAEAQAQAQLNDTTVVHATQSNTAQVDSKFLFDNAAGKSDSEQR